MTINFYLNSKKNKDDTYTLLAFIYGGNKRVSIKTGLKIKKEHWNSAKQNVKVQFKQSTEYNQRIQAITSAIKKLEQVILQKYPNIQAENLINMIKAEYSKGTDIESINKFNDNKGFFELFDEFLHFQETCGYKKPIRLSTIKSYKTLRQKLLEFEEDSKIKLDVQNFNQEVYNSYVKFLVNKKANTQNTIARGIKSIKTFLKWCNENSYLDNTDFKKFNQAEVPTNIIALTEEELAKIEKVELNNRYLERTRDTFLFSCYTGQRFIDIKNFEFDKIENNYWNLTTLKTNDKISIPLIDSALVLIAKYKRMECNSFPIISNQKTNDNLKKIAKLAEINQMVNVIEFKGNQRIETKVPKHTLITFHVARKTFITLSLLKKLPVPIVMSISGHKDYKTMQKYIDISKSAASNEILNAWNQR